jgi:aminopeptidase-like protein
MPPSPPLQLLDDSHIGEDLFALVAELYPICRSITGNGVRDTLRRLSRHIGLDVHEVPTNTPCFDWRVPYEWNIRDAFIKDASGARVLDFNSCNLHVVSYSVPVHGYFRLDELRHRIHTLPDQPDIIPYRTSYYKKDWGFCMAYDALQQLPDGTYEVLIDSTLEEGNLTYGEYLHRGETDQEILFSAHICHPSLANDNCSGVALLTLLAERLAPVRTRCSYRFLFAPGTIGAIVWLSRNQQLVSRLTHGLVVSGVGDPGGPTYKKSRRGNAAIDRIMAHVLRHAAESPRIVEFSPYGYDERQYCSPGFNLPVGLLQRSQFATFPEYHTSGDNLNLVRAEHLASSYRMIVAAIDAIEHDRRMLNLQPQCEPQLGRRGLYATMGGDPDGPAQAMALLWVLNFSDGEHSLLDIADRASLPFAAVRAAASRLEACGLLGPIVQAENVRVLEDCPVCAPRG